MARTDISLRKADILQWCSEHRSFMWMCKELNCARDTLKSYIRKWNFQYSGNQSHKGFKTHQYLDANELLSRIQQGVSISNSKLRDRLIEYGLKQYECEMCKNSVWMDKPIVLELHHKDFNHHNNDFDNLKILCSNCHSYVHRYKILT